MFYSLFKELSFGILLPLLDTADNCVPNNGGKSCALFPSQPYKNILPYYLLYVKYMV